MAGTVTDTVATRTGQHPMELLQILRGVAAIMVVFHHFCLATAEYHSRPSLLANSALGNLGAAGVDLFFVISGFIMVLTQQSATSSVSSALAFWKKRFVRIFPLYWFWTTVLLILWAGGLALQSHRYTWQSIAFSYLLWPSLGSNETLQHPFLDQGWTLSFEIYFYLLFGLSIALGVRSLRLPFLIAAFGILAIVGRVVGYPSGPGLLALNPLIIEFLLGAVAGTLATRLRDWGTRYRYLGFILLIGGGSALFASMWITDVLYGGVLTRALLWGVPAFMIVASAATYARDAFRQAHTLIRLGDGSYSIYLTHAFATLAAGTFMKRHTFINSIPPDLIVVLGTIATVWLCFLSFPLIEKPLLLRLRPRYGAR